jgi:hypothetical protein
MIGTTRAALGPRHGALTDKAHIIGRGGATAMHKALSVSRPLHWTFGSHRAGGEGFRSRPLRKAECHVHDRRIALRAHRKAASLEHIQHGHIFREDFGDELMKSGSTAEICEMPHQC